ncbi:MULTISPECIES: hypothetical protein [Nitrosomonas]|uniref:Uncharacterized protein n=1 Tax=Nitrosomonas communis TaxID=44574 RepID=A0A0F7KCF7_9PROT|nr:MULTISPECIES: hypothetical protein [Nitrosomonas]AKH38235.1 hypothetical protein AAW31_11245 [Nitrosomonas communis]TYP80657.1 hypothetical protein BCL69_10553 [Nitrosomonas communis]UVS60213.1 hypothetical protein NX761_11880 [Nitrosomonas sp. PLL12]
MPFITGDSEAGIRYRRRVAHDFVVYLCKDKLGLDRFHSLILMGSNDTLMNKEFVELNVIFMHDLC